MKRGKSAQTGNERVKQVLLMVSKKTTLQNRYKLNCTLNRKMFTAGHVLLTCSKHTRRLVPLMNTFRGASCVFHAMGRRT